MNKYIEEFNDFAETWMANNMPSSDRKYEPGSPLGVISYHKDLAGKMKIINDDFTNKVNHLLQIAKEDGNPDIKDLIEQLKSAGLEKINEYIMRAKGK